VVSMQRSIIPFGPIDPRLKMTIHGKEQPVCFWDYREIVHNRLAGQGAMIELRLDHAVKLLKGRC